MSLYSDEMEHVSTITESDHFIEQAADTWEIYDHNTNFMRTFSKVKASQCRSMLDQLSERGLWSQKTNSWTRFPCDQQRDHVLCPPFVEIANTVAELDSITHPRPDRSILTWIDTRSNKLQSYWPDTCDSFLDVTAVLKPVSAVTTPVNDCHHEPYAWNHVIIPGQFKQRNAPHTTVQAQLVHSVRQMYKEQPDRRFIFGFTFEFVFLTVWYFDRSGILSSEHINVHEV